MNTEIMELWPLALVVVQIFIYFMLGLLLIILNEFLRSETRRAFKAVDEYSDKISQKPIVLKRETWQAWGGAIHPGWLLGVRLVAFVYLLGLLIKVCIMRKSLLSVYYFYTEWTVTLLIVYFGWASSISIYEYQQSLRKKHMSATSEASDLLHSILIQDEGDIVGMTYACDEDLNPYPNEALEVKAGFYGYALQILFQTVGPAVVLTDCVYWTLLYPFFPESFPHSFLEWNLHAVNAVFLTTELFLNSMRFPWFRTAYFFVWSCIYLFFQWGIHIFGLVDAPWPYPFLDVATTDAPFWYFTIAILHVSAFAIISFLNRLKLLLQDRDCKLSPKARCWSLVKSLCPGG